MITSMFNRNILGVIFVIVASCLTYYFKDIICFRLAILQDNISLLSIASYILILLILINVKMSNKVFNCLILLFVTIILFYFKTDYKYLARMAGDNICQLGYWKILLHHNNIGSIGAAYTKPGQLIISGALLELNEFTLKPVFRLGICFIMSLCVLTQVIIAKNVSNKTISVLLLPVMLSVFIPEFYDGSFSIYLIPCLLLGLHLYEFSNEHKTIGRLLLVLSIQFHIMAIAPLFALLLIQFFRRNFKELVNITCYTAISLLVWLFVIFNVQGSLSRLNSGSAAGYVAWSTDFKGTISQFNVAINNMTTINSAHFNSAYLMLFIVGIVGTFLCLKTKHKIYLILHAFILVILLNVIVLGGEINTDRYFSIYYAFSITVGMSLILIHIAKLFKFNKLAGLASYYMFSMAVFTLINLGNIDLSSQDNFQNEYNPSLIEARAIINDNVLPNKLRIMTEDDLLAPIFIMANSRINYAASLQLFNILDSVNRASLLSKVDYIWLSTTGSRFNYLNYIARDNWNGDSFRLVLNKMINNLTVNTIYGYNLSPIYSDGNHLLIKVAKVN